MQLTQTKRVTPAPVGGPAAEGLNTDVQSLSLPWTQYCLKQIGCHWQSSVTGSPGGGRARLVTRARPVDPASDSARAR